MRRQGYELFRLDVRNYSSRALPGRYVWPTPAETLCGRPFQGEAYYAPRLRRARRSMRAKLLKLAAIYAAIGVPDMAAELLLARRAEIRRDLDIDKALDLLAAAGPARAHAQARLPELHADLRGRRARLLPPRGRLQRASAARCRSKPR